MAQFSFNEYQDVVAKAQQNNSSVQAVRVGFFKLANDGDEALVRINASSTDDLVFAAVHKPVFGKKFEGLTNPYAGISCLNPVGSYSDNCPLCKANAAGNTAIDKASKKLYLEMVVSYKDPTTGTWTAAQPVVWERPASYARDIASKLRDYGDLKNVLLKMTRIGSGKETRYTLDYAVTTVYKPEMVPADFSAFNNFKVNKHSYYEKTAVELSDYLTTGSFPQVEKEDTGAVTNPTVAQVAQAYAQPAYQAPVQEVPGTPAFQGYSQAPAEPAQNTSTTPTGTNRNFNGFSF